MLFLIEYDRSQGEVVTIREFDVSEREIVQNARLDMELRLNDAGTEHEVVLLEAASQEALRRTHRRYFENLSELMKAS
jgi:predicted dinucleotide-utilizing enzyme